jgi:hypothetical protein
MQDCSSDDEIATVVANRLKIGGGKKASCLTGNSPCENSHPCGDRSRSPQG